METYLRFSRADYRALCQVCRPLDLGDDFFPLFQNYLVDSLRDALPELAGRLASLGEPEVRIVFEHLRQTRPRTGPRSAPRRKPAAPQGLTAEEWRLVARAAHGYLLPGGFPYLFRKFLTDTLRESAPELVRKLTRFSDRRLDRLHARLRALPGGQP